jgi:phospholipase/carboxylesterase
MLLVHGRTGNLRLLEWYSKRFQVPGMAYMTIQAPYADQRPDQKDEGYSWFLENYEGLQKSRADLAAMIEEIHEHGLKYEQIYWLGFSQGAVMGLDLALRSNHILGGFFCISGFCLKTDEYPAAFGTAAKKQKILITHGTRDEILPFDRAKASYDKISALGVPLEFKSFDKPHSFHLQQEVPFLEKTLLDWTHSR